MKSRNLKKASQAFFTNAIIFIFVLFPAIIFAQMKEVSESELALVSAQAGISYNWGDSKMNISYDSFAISDTDSSLQNWLEFNNISITGTDGYFTLDEADHGIEGVPYYRFNTTDIGSLTTIDGQSRMFVQLVDSTNTNPRIWNIGNLVFCGQDLGSIQFDIRNIDSTILTVSTHGEGYSGIEFEYLSNWELSNFKYGYNTSGGSIDISGIHIAESPSGVGDSPSDPSTWAFSGRFRIGDIYGGSIDADNNPGNAAVSNPATFDVGTMSDGTTSTTCAVMNLPLKGTIRVENVTFGGNDFGPVAIDGITSHYLYVRFNPGN